MRGRKKMGGMMMGEGKIIMPTLVKSGGNTLSTLSHSLMNYSSDRDALLMDT
jgi:hypothetical protein